MDHDSNQNPFLRFNTSGVHRTTADGRDNDAHVSDHSATIISQNASGTHAQDNADLQMNADYDDMPPLQELSDSDAESESDRDANEVEMQAVDRNDGGADTPSTNSRRIYYHESISFSPYPSRVPQVRQNSNRRPRVEDDDDEERDRRHPSQRVSSTNNNAASSSSAQASSSTSLPHTQPQPHPHASTPISGPSDTLQPPTRPPSNVQRHVFHTTINLGPGGPANPFRLFQHLFPTNNTNDPNPTNIPYTDNSNLNAGNNVNNTPAAPPSGQPPQPPNGNNSPRPQQPIFGGVLSFDLGPAFSLPVGAAIPPMDAFVGGNPAANAQQAPGFPPNLADLFSRIGAQVLGGFGMDNQEDPDRARKLVDGLEVVPEGLVRRLERVGGSGGGMGEDPSKGGDSGCAICWDHLLDMKGESLGSSDTEEHKEESSFTEKDAEMKQRKIVSLPCAHIFHAECLIPWFSRPRQTTCPTCRFNIDPDNLTYVSWSSRQRERQQAEAAARAEPAAAENTEPTAAANLNAPPNVDAPPNLPTSGTTLNAANNDARSEASEQLLHQLAALYQSTNPDLAALFGRGNPPATQQTNQQEQTGGQLQDTQRRQGPAVTVASIPIPIPIPIPVAIPLGGIQPAATPHAEPSVNTALGQPQPSQVHPPPQGGSGLSGEHPRLFHPLAQPDITTPLDALLFSQLFRLGSPQASNSNPDASGSTNAPPSAAGPASPEGTPANGPRVLADTANRFPFNPGWPLGVGLGLGGLRVPNGNPPTAAPGARQPQTNTFNLDGLDFGMRADVVVTMDMFFDPIGAGGPRHPDDPNLGENNSQAADHHHHPEDDLPDLMEMEEDGMMFMPGEEDQGGEEDRFQNMLDMLSGTPHTPGSANRRSQRQSQPAQNPPGGTANQQRRQMPPGFAGGFHIAAGAGRSMGEAFAQLLAGMGGAPEQDQQGQPGAPDAQAQPEEGGAPAQPPQQGDAPSLGAQPQPQPRIRSGGFAGGFAMPLFGGMGGFPDIFGPGGPGNRRMRPEGPKPAWTLPPAPGPTLRQRIERREREAGLRCYDVSCGVGPSDEDPLSDEVSKVVSGMKQVVIRHRDEEHTATCEHRFHSACLVSAERVAQRGTDAVVEDGCVDVTCPVCRSAGCVTKKEWNEGVVALE